MINLDLCTVYIMPCVCFQAIVSSILLAMVFDVTWLVVSWLSKRSAVVAPNLDIRERTLWNLHNVNKAAHSGFEIKRKRHQKSKAGHECPLKNKNCGSRRTVNRRP